MNRAGYTILLLITIIAAVGGIVTLMPRSGASYENVLGYKSVCTFTPAATLFCFFIAGSSCFVRSTFIKDREGSGKERLRVHAKSLVPLVLVFILALGFTAWFLTVKARYPDGTTAATEQLRAE